jgi:hypothetical protein
VTAHDAIAQSARTTQLVMLDFNECDLDALITHTRDYVRGHNHWQFWGEHDGKQWRVHMRFPGPGIST